MSEKIIYINCYVELTSIFHFDKYYIFKNVCLPMVRRFSQKKKVDNFLDSRFQKNLAVSEILLKLVPVYGPSQFLIILD